MFWDMYQQKQIEANERKITSIKYSVSQLQLMEFNIRKNADRLEALTIACQAMWEILRDDAGMSEEKLMKKIEEVDLRSGAQNKKMPKADSKNCGKCKRPNNPRHNLCLYCGDYLDPSKDPHVFNI